MSKSRITFATGSRVRADFNTINLKIDMLAEFIRHVVAQLAGGSRLHSAVRSAQAEHPLAASAFHIGDTDGAIDAGFQLGDSLTFPDEPLPSRLRFQRSRVRLSLDLDTSLAGDVRSLLYRCASGQHTAQEIRRCINEPMTELFDALLESEILVPAARHALIGNASDRPGVTRLQHASVIYRGQRAGVLVDPHLHSDYEPEGLVATFSRPQFQNLVDAVVISHGHEDHWHLPTIMTFPRETLFIVPKVPRPTILCPDFAATLRALGFTRVEPLGWFDPPVIVDDLEIHALPFFGEQPLLRDCPRHPDLRNHGNTYVVRHQTYTSWLLIDSGSDNAGTMTSVAHDVRARFGTIDTLLSNLREFAIGSPMYITGGGHYWLALTPEQMARFATMWKDVITLGPGGVAEICKIVGARVFLPYAHEWGPIGAPPSAQEVSLVRELDSALKAVGSDTEIWPWRIGDSHRYGSIR